jgi:hypothetical protein
VSRAEGRWISTGVAPTHPQIATKLRAGEPMIVLGFLLAGDSNVLDACFMDGEPFAKEYH